MKKRTENKKAGVKTRFAPSPTGFFHIGGVRTALFNYIFAKQNKGKFILRIEDTDIERSKPEFEKDMIDSLKWVGIKWDEGPGVAGKFGPYRQRERIEIYKKYLEKLLEEKKAYYCFCTKEELEALRQYQESNGIIIKYPGKCADLSPEKVKERLVRGEKAVIRMKMPDRKIQIKDLIRGKVEFDTSLIGDFVIAKDLDTPLYHFSVVIDDYEMEITHVIRGEEHLSNTPKHIILQEALGLPTPHYAHLPLILAPDRTKLSKRHGAVSAMDYKKQGYLPEALINFLAFLGWNPGANKEIYSLKDLIKDFSIDKIHKGGAIFNIQKLDFINGFYIRHKTINELVELCLPYLLERGLISDAEAKKKETLDYLVKVVALYQERLKKLSEISELAEFFFKENISYDKELLKWKGVGDKELSLILKKLEQVLSDIEEADWSAKKIESVLMPEAEKFPAEISLRAGDRGYMLWAMRAALSGQKSSAGPFEIATVLGKEKALKRIKNALNFIQKT